MPSNTQIELPPGGLLLVDKPKDFSSHDVISVCRRVLKTKKIGHSGTLDPMATGLLILLIGRDATRRQDQFLKMEKTYSAELTLGEETDSWDAYGETISKLPVPLLTQARIEEAARKFSGAVHQPIPFFSAKRVRGSRMYELARKGAPMERKYNDVTVEWRDIRLNAPNKIEFTVCCSCGTYVRSLGWLLARELGTAGHLTVLRRKAIGPFSVQNAFDGNLIKGCDEKVLRERIIPADVENVCIK